MNKTNQTIKETSKEPSFLEKKRRSLNLLKTDVEGMKERFDERREQQKRKKSRRDIIFWMDHAILPFIQGVASNFDESLTEGIQRLIREKKNPFTPKRDWNRTQETDYVLTKFLEAPQTKVLQIMAKPFLRQRMDWVYKEAEWIREEILKEDYPQLYNAVMETPGGKEWLDQLIEGFMKRIKSYLGR